MCRIQGALIEKDYDRIKKIQKEIKERLDELRNSGVYNEKSAA